MSNKSRADMVLPGPWVSLAGGGCPADPPPGLLACSLARGAGRGEGGDPFGWVWKDNPCSHNTFGDVRTCLWGLQGCREGDSCRSPVFLGDQPRGLFSVLLA